MNEDEALRALAISKRRFEEGGQYDSALKFAEKAVRLCETSETLNWLEFLKTQKPSDSAAPPPRKPTQQASSDSKSSSTPTPSDAPQRPYTPDQVAGIKKIKAMKAKGDLYGILGVEKSASDSEIKKAYRKLALQYHPDKCGAPGTDEAFKAINHSWTVLGDEGKKEQYDRYGVDPESRGGGGGSAARNPFAGGGHAFRGHSGFQEVNPEELFNMFFGEMGGMGGNGFHFQTNFGGPRYNTRFQQQQQQQRRQQQQQQQQGGTPQFIQALPIIILMLISFFSTFTAPSDPSLNENSYSWEYGAGYTLKRSTHGHDVDYYVNPKMFSDRYDKPQFAWKLKNFEKSIEGQYYRNIHYRCQQEREYKQQLISSAYTLFRGVDEVKLKKAQNYEMQFCQQVEQWNTRASNPQKIQTNNNAAGKAGARKRAAGAAQA
ncbi:DnaJ-domain-containing protein [Rhizoclosmatium globosum]|uniref:DnaJ-domain-containing protein n=1 Tax=Rhizoclosmatium globosum TaxID=329046 RepID=A0A1Y2CYE7_9FUNG|nr:hypothetical protein HDU99_003646 [Rhizoclosmatium hyalinum]KAJ3289788.1 hypothetical protein HDU79_003793 [Rhizoclosmatium sp. JEL0117]ORY51874.1 DnaJ-domain-containing protein [Rhizoclosmatium globosum]|eukprot:ORY51874.1 DnaJ-domain-containing protein [Rhizoclosmatium globosum]